MENSSYFGASRHKLSAFFSLLFRFSSCHHPLLASALAKIMQDQGNRVVVGKDENAVRKLISMISSNNQHVVCWQSLTCCYHELNLCLFLCYSMYFCKNSYFLVGQTSMLCSINFCWRCSCRNTVDEM